MLPATHWEEGFVHIQRTVQGIDGDLPQGMNGPVPKNAASGAALRVAFRKDGPRVPDFASSVEVAPLGGGTKGIAIRVGTELD